MRRKVTTRRPISAVREALSDYAEFMSFASDEFHTKYGTYPQRTTLEREAVLKLVNRNGGDKLRTAWSDLLKPQHGLSPEITIRPFSELIGRVSKQRTHEWCVDGRAHIPPEHYT